jgi:hypothetical protein
LYSIRFCPAEYQPGIVTYTQTMAALEWLQDLKFYLWEISAPCNSDGIPHALKAVPSIIECHTIARLAR